MLCFLPLGFAWDGKYSCCSVLTLQDLRQQILLNSERRNALCSQTFIYIASITKLNLLKWLILLLTMFPTLGDFSPGTDLKIGRKCGKLHMYEKFKDKIQSGAGFTSSGDFCATGSGFLGCIFRRIVATDEKCGSSEVRMMDIYFLLLQLACLKRLGDWFWHVVIQPMIWLLK